MNACITPSALIERLLRRGSFDGPVKVTDRKSATAFLDKLTPKRINDLTLDEFRLLCLEEPLLPLFINPDDSAKICGACLVDFDGRKINGRSIDDLKLGKVFLRDRHVGMHLNGTLDGSDVDEDGKPCPNNYYDDTETKDAGFHRAASALSIKKILNIAQAFELKDQMALRNVIRANNLYQKRVGNKEKPSDASQYLTRRNNCRQRMTSAKFDGAKGSANVTSGNCLKSSAETVIEARAWHEEMYGVGPMNDILTGYADSMLTIISLLEGLLHFQDTQPDQKKPWNSVPMQAIPYPRFDYHVFSPSTMHYFSKEPWNQEILPREFKEDVDPRESIPTDEQVQVMVVNALVREKTPKKKSKPTGKPKEG